VARSGEGSAPRVWLNKSGNLPICPTWSSNERERMDYPTLRYKVGYDCFGVLRCCKWQVTALLQGNLLLELSLCNPVRQCIEH